MHTKIVKCLVVCMAGVLLAYAIIALSSPLFDDAIRPSAWVLGFVGPFAIGVPLSWFLFRQNERLNATNAKLAAARAALDAANARPYRKADVDPMTGLLDRERFFKALEDMRRRSDSGTLLIVDVDHFKAIKDDYGRRTANEALVAITRAITRSVRLRDLVGRIGGAEFAIFLVGARPVEARFVAERIRFAVESIHFEPRSGTVRRLTTSIGGIIAASDTPVSELVRDADQSLYDAKRSGRNLVVIRPDNARAA